MTGGKNRYLSRVKAIRKRKLDKDVCWYSRDRSYGRYDNLNQYSKNKIHCSCPMCSSKTRNKGSSKHKGMSPTINYKISDLRKVQRMDQSEAEYLSV